MQIDLEKIELLIRDYGNRFWAKEEAERIIQHIRDSVGG